MILSMSAADGYSHLDYISAEFTAAGLPIVRGRLVRLYHDQPGEAELRICCPVCGCEHHHGWDIRHDHRIVEARVCACDRSLGLRGVWYHVSVYGPDDWRYSSHIVRPGRRRSKGSLTRQGGRR